MRAGAVPMGYDSIRIERDREGYCVRATDPAISAANAQRKNDSMDGWKDPCVEFDFETKAQVLAFLDKAMDIALPADEYTSAFDKLAKQAKEES